MAEFSGFFDADPIGGGRYDREYLAKDFAGYFASLVGNGVFAGKSDELQVYQDLTPSMSIRVYSGQGWINGYRYENTAEKILSVGIPDGVNDRIDLVVLQWRKIDRIIQAVLKKGTPSKEAVAPSLQRDSDVYELGLAQIHVKAGASSISQSDITDTRTNPEMCGWVTALIEQADIHTLFVQWEAQFTTWFDTIQNTLSGDTAGNLLGLIQGNTRSINNLSSKVDSTLTQVDQKLKNLFTDLEIALPVSSWSKSGNKFTQKVSVPGMTANMTVTSAPKQELANLTECMDSLVFCSGQSEGFLTFECESKPSKSVTMNISYREKGGQ